jgi:hypothetical protein
MTSSVEIPFEGRRITLRTREGRADAQAYDREARLRLKDVTERLLEPFR